MSQTRFSSARLAPRLEIILGIVIGNVVICNLAAFSAKWLGDGILRLSVFRILAKGVKGVHAERSHRSR